MHYHDAAYDATIDKHTKKLQIHDINIERDEIACYRVHGK